MKNWFVTWDREEYKEWAAPISGGYLLLIVRKEKGRHLCVKAKLKMGTKGLPSVSIIEEVYLPTTEEASRQISNWKKK
ncbi:MAG: hypothetical protein A3A51_00300 [Candidatus Levybacteria bacterium RIFCSPLOWO2_01_FULL_39_10]|nr:MAG: hypothetical protein A3A51_00300 [Candidatus Levybacteria bacterium RIFCSPLOWO2_01_FULL_39_10]